MYFKQPCFITDCKNMKLPTFIHSNTTTLVPGMQHQQRQPKHRRNQNNYLFNDRDQPRGNPALKGASTTIKDNN